MENYTREQVLELMTMVREDCLSIVDEDASTEIEENISVEDILQDFDDSLEV